jgi:hypothetical protein
MKHSKIFIGLMTGVLAVAAVAATKASKFTHALKKGYVNANNNGCTVFVRSYYTQGSGAAVTGSSSSPIKSYVAAGSHCGNQLFTAPLD